jgi:hypothetical protein
MILGLNSQKPLGESASYEGSIALTEHRSWIAVIQVPYPETPSFYCRYQKRLYCMWFLAVSLSLFKEMLEQGLETGHGRFI